MICFFHLIVTGDRMKRVVIAACTPDLAEALRQALCRNYEVHICENGNELPAVLEELQPEALILNLFMKNTNGIRVLKQTRYKPPVIMGFTYVLNDSLCIDAYNAGICELLRLPCPKAYMVQQFGMLMGLYDQLKGGM